jgi:hypothetical protein
MSPSDRQPFDPCAVPPLASLGSDSYFGDDLDLATLEQLRKKFNLPVQPYKFAGVLNFAIGGVQRQVLTFQVDADAHFVYRKIGIAASNITGPTTNPLDTVNVRIVDDRTARQLDSDEVLASTLVGTVGLPFEEPVPMLFRRQSQFRIIVQNIAPAVTATNRVAIVCAGMKVFPRLT